MCSILISQGQVAYYWETSCMGGGESHLPLPTWGAVHPPEGYLCDPDLLCPPLIFLPSRFLPSLIKSGSCSSFDSLLQCHLPCPPSLNLVPSSGSLYPTALLSSEHLHGCYLLGLLPGTSTRMSAPGRQKPYFH